jgi:hypothetical protein
VKIVCPLLQPRPSSNARKNPRVISLDTTNIDILEMAEINDDGLFTTTETVVTVAVTATSRLDRDTMLSSYFDNGLDMCHRLRKDNCCWCWGW